MTLRPALIAALILVCLPAFAAVVSTSDGLSLSLSAEGQVAGLTASGRKLAVTEGGGFYAIDMAARAMPTRAGLAPAEPVVGETRPSAPAWLRGPLKVEKGVVTQTRALGELGLKLETSCASAGGYLSFSGKLTDLTGRDRAVEVGYEIPLAARGWTWSDDIVRSRTVAAEETYRSSWDCAAGPGYSAIYPFSSLASGNTGISLGVPLAQGPRVYSIEYDVARQCLRIRFHFGLSRAVKKLPGQAWFSFLLYQHDGQWGMRSAAERYYALFPGGFEKRVPREGYLGYANLETTDGTKGARRFYGVPALGDFGSGFNWIWHGDDEAAGPEVSPTVKESLEGALSRWRAEQPQARPYEWCLSIDGAGFTGRQMDFRAEHLALSDVPLTYDNETKQPAIADVAWEFNSQVLAPLAKRYKVLLHRKLGSAPEVGDGLGSPPYAVGASITFVDIGLIECVYGKWGWTEDVEAYVRTSGYRKIFRYWFCPPEDEKRGQAIREMFQRCLPYAIYPHLLPDAAQYRDLYLRYVPVVERLSAAGWEPVTLAKAKDPDVHVERYGRVADSNLAFAARNVGTEAKRVRLVLDEALGLEAERLEVRDLLTGEPVMALAEGKGKSGLEAPPTTSVALPLILGPGESVALSVLPREGQLRAALLSAAECLRQASELCNTDEMSYQASRPGELLVGDTPESVRADTVLSDGWSSYQGLIWRAGEPLTIRVDLNSPHRLRWLRLHYGYTDAYEIPEVMVEGQDREGNWEALGKVAGATGAAGTTAPLLQALTPGPSPKGRGENLQLQGEYQILRLTWPALSKMVWLKEIEVEGEDAALLRAAERFETLAELGPARDLGLAGQLTIALRVRRMLGHDKTLQERALSYLSDFTSTATGLFVSLYIPPDAPAIGPVQATLVVVNRGNDPLHEGSIKLKLPPGWSAAPTKFEVELPAGQTKRLPVTVVRSAEGHLTLLTTGSVGTSAIFMSRWL
ncbi:MAG: NEW3 domain-containing protein [Armatimonadota bacterium]